MKTEHKLIDAMVARAERRNDRRAFLKASGGTAAVVAGTTLLGGCFDDDDRPRTPPDTGTPPPPPSAAIGDGDILNFALQLEYLEAQFYSFAAFGRGLDASLLTGQGVQGAVTGGRQVNFTDPIIAQYAREIAQDELAHVRFLRTALGSAAVAQPPINISSDASGPFSAAARAAGLVGANQAFDPYASDENFLLGAYIFEDVGVTAYKGASPLITNKTFLEAAAGILAAEAYHAALVRTILFGKGISTPAPALIDATQRISDARDSLDGSADLDQGVAIRDNGSNIVPTDQNGIVFSRSGAQVLNIVFLTQMAAQQGGFFPRGVNGRINTSSAAG